MGNTEGVFLDEDGILRDDEGLYNRYFTQRTGTDSGLGLHEQPSQTSTQNYNKMADNQLNYLSISQPTQDASCDDSHPMEEKSLHVSDFEDSYQEDYGSHRSLQSGEESELVQFHDQDSPSTSKLGSLRLPPDEDVEGGGRYVVQQGGGRYVEQPYHLNNQHPLIFHDVGEGEEEEEEESMQTESITDSKSYLKQNAADSLILVEEGFTQNDLTNQSGTQQRHLSLLEFEKLEGHFADASDGGQAPDLLMEYLQSSNQRRNDQGAVRDSEDVIHAVYEDEEEEEDYSQSSHEQKSEGSGGSSRQSRLDTFKSDQDGRNTASSLGQQTSAKTVINMYEEDNLDNSFDDSIAQVSGASGFFMTETRESTPSPSKIPVYSQRNSPSMTPTQSRSRSRSHSGSRVNSRPNTPHSGRNTPSRIPKWSRGSSPQAPPVSQSNSRTGSPFRSGSPRSRPWSRSDSPLRAETPSKIPVKGERSSRPSSRSNTPVSTRRGAVSPKTSTPSTPVRGLKSGSSSRIPSPKLSNRESTTSSKSHSQIPSRPRSSDSQRSGYRVRKSASNSRPDSGSSRRSGYSNRGRGSPKLLGQTHPKTSWGESSKTEKHKTSQSETRADEPNSRSMFTQANREATYMQKQPQGIPHADSHRVGPSGDFWSKPQRHTTHEPEYGEGESTQGEYHHTSATSELNSEFDDEEIATRELSERLGEHYTAPGFPSILPDKPLKPSKAFKIRHSTGKRGRTNRPLRVMSDRSSAGEHDEIMSISSDASKGQLTARLKEEKTQRIHTDELVNQLQNDYDKLLEKYALAEVTIDQLRLGAKIHLHSDPPEASRSYQGVVPSPQRPQVFDIPKTSRATMGVIAQAGPQKAHLSSGQSPDGATEQSPGQQLPWQQDSSLDSTQGFDGNPSLTATTSGESWKLALTFQAKGLEDKLNSFQTLLDESQLEPAEQELVYNKIKSEFDKLQQDYLAAKENHELMRRQGTLASGGTNMEFDENKEMEGELFKLGMKLDAIGERVQEDLDSRPSSRVPFQNKEHSHHSHKHASQGQGQGHHKQGHGHTPPRSRSSSTSAAKQKKKPSKVDSVTDAMDAPVEPAVSTKLQRLQGEYRALMDKYDKLKQLPRTPDRDREINQLIGKIQELSSHSPGDFPLPSELHHHHNMLKADDRQYASSSPDGYRYTDSSSPTGPAYKNPGSKRQGQGMGSYSSIPDSGLSTPTQGQQPIKMKQPRQRLHDDVDSGFVGSESSRQSLLPGQQKMNLSRGSKVHLRQRGPQHEVQEEQPQWAGSVGSESDVTSVQPRKRESRGTSSKRASSRQRPQSSKSSKSHDSVSSRQQSSKRSRHSSSRSSQRPSSQISLQTESDGRSSISMVSSTSSRRSTKLQSLHDEIAKMKESLLNWTEAQRQSVFPPSAIPGKENVEPRSETGSRHSRPRPHAQQDVRNTRASAAPSGRQSHQPQQSLLRREDLEDRDFHSEGFDPDQTSIKEPTGYKDWPSVSGTADRSHQDREWTGNAPSVRDHRPNPGDHRPHTEQYNPGDHSTHRPAFPRCHSSYRKTDPHYEEERGHFQGENEDYDNDPVRLRKDYEYYIPRPSGYGGQEGAPAYRRPMPPRDPHLQPPDYHSAYRPDRGVPPPGHFEDSPHRSQSMYRPDSQRMTRSELGATPGRTGVKTVSCPLCGGSGYHTHTELNYVYQPQQQPTQTAPAAPQPLYTTIQQPSVPVTLATVQPASVQQQQQQQQQPVYLQPVTPVQQHEQQQQQQSAIYLQPVTPVQSQKPVYLQPVTPVVLNTPVQPITSTPVVRSTSKVRYYVKEHGDDQSRSSRSSRKSHQVEVSDREEYDSELEDSLREATRSARKLKKITRRMRGDVKDDLSRSLRYSTLLA